MSLMTAEERAPYTRRGFFATNKCDLESCGKPIASLSYNGSRGEYCSKACFLTAEGKQRKKDKKMSEAAEETEVQEAPEAPAKKKKKKKKAVVEAPPEKKKKKKAKEEPAKSGKKKKKPAPFPEREMVGPFAANGALGVMFQMCLDGTTLAKLEKAAEKLDVDFRNRFVHIRKGSHKGFNWKYIEKDGGRVKCILK